jgi:pSer/pThr/pTyr-binding forkhead associated (FHA) protein
VEGAPDFSDVDVDDDAALAGRDPRADGTDRAPRRLSPAPVALPEAAPVTRPPRDRKSSFEDLSTTRDEYHHRRALRGEAALPPALTPAEVRPVAPPLPRPERPVAPAPPAPARATTGPRLLVVAGNDRGREIPLRGQRLTIGRAVDNDVVLTDIAVSRRHIEISPQGEHYLVRDLGSGNGTLINDQLHDGAYQLRDSDRLELGNTVIQFSDPARAIQSEPQPDVDEEASTLATDRGADDLAAIAQLGRSPALSGPPRPVISAAAQQRLVLPPRPTDPAASVAQAMPAAVEAAAPAAVEASPGAAHDDHSLPAVAQAVSLRAGDDQPHPGLLQPVRVPPLRDWRLLTGGIALTGLLITGYLVAGSGGKRPAPQATEIRVYPASRTASGVDSEPAGLGPAEPTGTGQPPDTTRAALPAVASGAGPATATASGATPVGAAGPAVAPAAAPHDPAATGAPVRIGPPAPVAGGTAPPPAKPGAPARAETRTAPQLVRSPAQTASPATGAAAVPPPAPGSQTAGARRVVLGPAAVLATVPTVRGGTGRQLPLSTWGTDESRPSGSTAAGRAAPAAIAARVRPRGESRSAPAPGPAAAGNRPGAGKPPPQRLARTGPPAAGKRAAAAASDEAAAALTRALSLYKALDFRDAAAVLRKAAGEADGPQNARLRTVASDYETVGANLALGESNQSSNPTAAMAAYERALRLDQRSAAGAHGKLIRLHLSALAPKVPASHMAQGRFEAAREAILAAERYGAGDHPMVNRVREALERKAGEFYRSAYTQRKQAPAAARALLQRIVRMVPPSSPWHPKATRALEIFATDAAGRR